MSPLPKVRHRKERTLARVEAEFRALDRVVRRLRPDDFRRPVPGFGERARIARERWTPKDALAHVVEWKRQMLRSFHREGSDPELRGLEIAEKNRLIYERWRRRSASEVIAFHREVHREIVRTLRALPDGFFTGTLRSPIWPNDLVGHSALHRRRHLEPALARTQPGSG